MNPEEMFIDFSSSIGLSIVDLRDSRKIPDKFKELQSCSYDFYSNWPLNSKDIENLFIEITSEGPILPPDMKRKRGRISNTKSIYHKPVEEALRAALIHFKEIPLRYQNSKTKTMLIIYSTRIGFGTDVMARKDNPEYIERNKNTTDDDLSKYWVYLDNQFNKTKYDFLIIMSTNMNDSKNPIIQIFCNEFCNKLDFVIILKQLCDKYGLFKKGHHEFTTKQP